MTDQKFETQEQESSNTTLIDDYPWEYVLVFSIQDDNNKTIGFRHVIFLDKQPNVKESIDLFTDVLYNPRHINQTTKDDDRSLWTYNLLKKSEKTVEFLRSLDIIPV